MLLQALNEYARRQNLIESIELTNRTIHLLLNLRADGTISAGSPWLPLESPDPKDKKGEKRILGSIMVMPRFPGENNGGKAHFLADGCGPVLGIDPKTGLPLPDDPKVGKNATKAFLHFWRRIEEARDTTKSPALDAPPDVPGPSALDPRNFVRVWSSSVFRPIGKSETPTFSALTLTGTSPIHAGG